jgi:hypothetical protein
MKGAQQLASAVHWAYPVTPKQVTEQRRQLLVVVVEVVGEAGADGMVVAELCWSTPEACIPRSLLWLELKGV